MHRDGCRSVLFSRSFISVSGQPGYSLTETLSVLAIVSVLGVTSLSLAGVVRDERLGTGANDLMAALSLARSSAITRTADVVVCPSRDGRRCDAPDNRYTWWHDGYLVFVDQDGDRAPDTGEPVLYRGATSGHVSLRSSRYRTRVVYHPNGMTAGSNLTFTFCPIGSGGVIRSVIISNTGRARVSRAAGDHLPCDG
jgi:type IV fimbrial biogenesis protein FimT